jgi:hypothetical protein
MTGELSIVARGRKEGGRDERNESRLRGTDLQRSDRSLGFEAEVLPDDESTTKSNRVEIERWLEDKGLSSAEERIEMVDFDRMRPFNFSGRG